jgi:lactate racemase
MEIAIPYGRSNVKINIPDRFPVDWIEAPQAAPAADPLQVVCFALDAPSGRFDLADFSGAGSVAIAINDKTRMTPYAYTLPPLLKRLEKLGIPQSAVRLYIANGTHPSMVPQEYPLVLPEEILNRFQVVSHDAYAEPELVYLGETSWGTPLWTNRSFYQSDFKIVTGNIEPHQFVGFSGGVKSAVIGLAGHATIQQNHSWFTHPDAQLGSFESNPVRQDLDRQIIYALAGTPRAVMEAGVPLSRRVSQVEVEKRYGLVISSPGGHPKDINLYQAQKGLAHSAMITRPGGTVILAAACPEGTGSQAYEDWMVGRTSHRQVLEDFTAEVFRIGPHKAFQIARDALRVKLRFFSEMDRGKACDLLLNPETDLQEAVDKSLTDLAEGERVGVMAHAASTIPYLVG